MFTRKNKKAYLSTLYFDLVMARCGGSAKIAQGPERNRNGSYGKPTRNEVRIQWGDLDGRDQGKKRSYKLGMAEGENTTPPTLRR